MDSDVSAEDDFDNESPKNGAWMSSNSDGHQSSSDQGSPAKNSDRASSSSEGDQLSSNVKLTSNSNHESSPEAKESDTSDKDDDDDEVDDENEEDDGEDNDDGGGGSSVSGGGGDNDADDDDDDNDDEDDEDDNDGDDDDADNERKRKAKASTGDSSCNRRPTDIDDIAGSQSSHELSDQRNSPLETGGNRDSECNRVKNTDDSPPPLKNDAWSDGVYKKQVSSKSDVAAASPHVRDHDDENDGVNRDNNRSDDRSRRNSKNDAEDDANTPYESVNGDLSPKSPKCSNSAGWDSRSELASSLDSVSPSQFERQQSASKYEISTLDQTEKIPEIKKTIIDFADDLSDVSDIESNDSYAEREENSDQPDRTETDEQQKIVHQNEELPQDQQQQQQQQHHHHHHHRHHSHQNQRRQLVAESINEKHVDDGAVSLHVEGEEQLDFEAEEGECSPKLDRIKESDEEAALAAAKRYEEKEKDHSDLEEGELTDDNDAKPEETERPVCRFFSRGHCTWGSNCRFIHPGVMDKGNYSMFDTVRPIITAGGAPPPNSNASIMYPVFPPHLAPHSHLPAERPSAMVSGGGAGGGGNVGIVRKDEPALESSWERGLRQAKEMIRKSSKRKETEVDFEDKKMNLTLSQDEIDKENDYYSRNSASPGKSPDGGDKWKLDADVKSHRIAPAEPYGSDVAATLPHAGADVPPLGYYPPLHHGISRPAAADYWTAHRMGGLPYDEYGLRAPPLPYGADYYAAAAAAAAGRRYMHPNSYYGARPANVSAPQSHHPEFYDRKQKHKPYPSSSREVIVQKNDKTYKDDSPSRYRNRREDSPRMERTRDDEWADPWMRTKSPASGRARRRKDAYSSASSYSSSSESSRSSSRSSFSSKSRHSRSRSKARSSGSHSQSHSSSRSASESHTRKKAPMQFKLSPSSRTQLPAPKKAIKSISPTLLLERRAATERAMHMNPPPPSPKVKTRPHSPPTANVGGGSGGHVVASSALPSSATSPRAKSGLPDRLLAHSKAAVAAAMRSTRSSESRSSKSSSGSSSSDSSSDSSDSSASSSSTSKSSKTPPIRTQKRNLPANDHSATSQTVKNKAMDALKLSGQKQQIKLTLKGSGNATQSKRVAAATAAAAAASSSASSAFADNLDTRKEKPLSAGKKRAAQSTDSDSDSDRASSAKKNSKANQKKGVPSRREELLKQLKAVEDAIARKKSKIS